MSIEEWYRMWASFIKDTAPLKRGKVFKEFPMQPVTDQIYYITLNYKAQPKVETINLTINLKCKKTLENE